MCISFVSSIFMVFDLCSDVLNSEECQRKSFSLLKCLLFSKPFSSIFSRPYLHIQNADIAMTQKVIYCIDANNRQIKEI